MRRSERLVLNTSTRKSVRELVVIHPIDELNIVRELGEIVTWVDIKKKIYSSCPQT